MTPLCYNIMLLTPAERVEDGDDDAAEEHAQPGHQQDVDQEDEHSSGHAASHPPNMTLVNLGQWEMDLVKSMSTVLDRTG